MKLVVLCILSLLFGIIHGYPKVNHDLEDTWIHKENNLREFSSRIYNPKNDVAYILYTKENPSHGQIIKKGDKNSIAASNFKINKPVKFTIHGWTENADAITNTLLRAAYLPTHDINLIVIDWAKGAGVDYPEAVQNTHSTGKSVAEFLDWLNTLGVPFKNMHIVGHSLGGQMAGIIGRNGKRGRLEQITALDAAFPLWNSTSKLTKNDANYVEVIHTNAGVTGIMSTAGHNDFYPNGGVNMPGCSTSDIFCSHQMSIRYMAYSIANNRFRAKECRSVSEALLGESRCTGTRYLHMGDEGPKPVIGILALKTLPEPPYYIP